MLRPIIHIGFHKTGTSLLQREVFRKLNRQFLFWPEDRHYIHSVFVNLDTFGSISDKDQRSLNEACELARSSNRCLVISHERLSGYFASGGYDRRDIALRLKAALPNAKIIIGIREQLSLIRSIYWQYIADGGALRFRRFFSSDSDRLRRMPCFRAEYLDFSKIVSQYYELFEADSVLILPIELLRTNPQAYAERLEQFCLESEVGEPQIEYTNLIRQVNRRGGLGRERLLWAYNVLFNRNQLNQYAIPVPNKVGSMLRKMLIRIGTLLDPISEFTGSTRRRSAYLEMRYADFFRTQNEQLLSIVNDKDPVLTKIIHEHYLLPENAELATPFSDRIES